MRRVPVVLLAVCALFVTACGEPEPAVVDAGGSSAPLPEPSVVDAEQSAALLREPAAVLASVANAAEATPDSFRMHMELEAGGFEELAGENVGLVMTAAVSEESGEFSIEVDDPEFAAIFGDGFAMKYIGDTVYVSSQLFAFFGPIDTPWIVMTEADRQEAGDMTPEMFDTAELLAVLDGLGSDIEVLGTEELDGVTTTHIGGTVSVDEAFLGQFDLVGAEALAVGELDLELWIGDDDIVRRMEFAVRDETAFFDLTFELSNVGEPVVVEVPPASEVTSFEEIAVGLFGDFGFSVESE